MSVTRIDEKKQTRVLFSGRIDSGNADELASELSKIIPENKVVFDFKDVPYIASAGLRVILTYKKNLPDGVSMIITGLSEDVKETFDLTGFSNMFIIKKKA